MEEKDTFARIFLINNCWIFSFFSLWDLRLTTFLDCEKINRYNNSYHFFLKIYISNVSVRERRAPKEVSAESAVSGIVSSSQV